MDKVNDAIAILIAYSNDGKEVWLTNMKRVNELREVFL
jgi:hypothetical protein